MKRKDWVLLDTETTGVSDTSEILQVGILSSDGEVLMDSLVRPVYRTRIPAESTAIHGITMDMLDSAPTMPEIMPRLREVLQGKTVVIYNVSFDTRLIQQTLKKNGDGGIQFQMRTDCAMARYSEFVGEWSQYKADYKWQKLPSAAHRAVDDCKVTLALIREMANAPIDEEGTDAMKLAALKKYALPIAAGITIILMAAMAWLNR